MNPRSLILMTALLLATSGCLRFDTFVYEAIPISDLSANLMAKSAVPVGLYKEVHIIEKDGTNIDAYLLTHDPADGTEVSRHNAALLYCHGQDNNIETNVPRTDMLWELGYSIFVFDYRGFGKSTGTPTDVGVEADTDAAYQWLAAAPNAFQIGVYGRSLGTAMCLHGAVDNGATALALESPISSIQQIINDSTTLVTPSDFYVDSLLDNLTEVPKFTGDLFIMHGTADTYVPPEYGEELYALSQGHARQSTLWLVPGADHETVPCTSKVDPTEQNSCVGGIPAGVSQDWIDKVTGFFDAALNLSPPVPG